MKRQITFLIVVIAMFGLVFFQTAFGTATSLAVEQIDLRTSNAKVYQNSDGSGYAEVYQIPVHYQDEQGVWQEIDNTLVLNTNGVWENVGNSFNVSLSSATETLNRNTVSKTTLPMASFTNGLYTIAFAPIGTQASVGEVSESKITYSNAYPSADLIYQVTNMSLKEAVVYHKIPTNQTLEFALFVTGGIPTLHPNGSLSLGDCSNNCLQVQPPYLEDATGAITENIVVNLTKIDEGAYILEYLLGSEWLSASERVYPVIFDPTVTQHVGTFYYAQERSANTASCNAQRYTFVGYSPDSDLGGYGKRKTRTYFHFGLPSLPSGSTITGATLYAWQHILSGGNTGGYTSKVYRVTSNWLNNCTAYTWNNQPSVDGTERANSFITTSQDWKTWNITGLVQQWYGGTDNYGLMIAADPETARGSAFCSVVAGDGQCGANTEQKRPYIVISYNVSATSTPIHTPTKTPLPAPTATPAPTIPPQPKADLIPYSPLGWSSPIVASSNAYNNYAPLSGYDKHTFTDIAIANVGNADAINVYANLYTDNLKVATLYWPRIKSNTVVTYLNYKHFVCPGNHNLRLVIDPANYVTESNESNNVYIKNLTWSGYKPIDQGSWMPCGQSNLKINYTSNGTRAWTSQGFVWDAQRLNQLKSFGGVYQYEIRRDKEYWDYFKRNWFSCSKAYFTNLPGATDKWSEESDLGLLPCLVRIIPGDEEFEIKTKRISELEVGVIDYVSAYFYRDEDDKGKNMIVTSESEWCKHWPLCLPGSGNIYWGQMSQLGTTALADDMQSIQNTNSLTATVTSLEGDVYLIEVEGNQLLVSSPFITSTTHLRETVQQNSARIEIAEPSENYSATVTFRSPLSQSDFASILGNTQILSAHFVSWPQGGGKVPYPFDADLLSNMQIEFTNVISETTGQVDSTLIAGIVGADIIANGATIQMLIADTRILLLDIGPIEYQLLYPNAVLVTGDNIYYDYTMLFTNKMFLPVVSSN